jgi:glutamate:GABA antiporter
MSQIPEQAPRLPRALNLRDLVLFNLAAVVNLTWMGTAAKAGVSGLTLWLLASLLFFIPQGLAVVALSGAHPEEGGIYAWTKREFGEGHGFFCGWGYIFSNVVFLPGLILTLAASAPYAVGMGASGLNENWLYVLTFTMAALWLATLVNVVGLGTGKWLQNAGGAGLYCAGAILIFLGLYAVFTQPPANEFTAASFVPRVDHFSSLNFWATIAFAYAGLELSSTMGDEIKDARRNLPRSVYLAAPLAALVYILGTGAILWLLPVGDIDATSAPFRAASTGAARLGDSFLWIGYGAAALGAVGLLGKLGAWMAGPARMAFVIGIDRYFPASFGRVHARFRTPYVALLAQATLATLFTLFGVLGKGTTLETAFLVLIDMSILLYFIPFVYLFLCFIRHVRRAEGGANVPLGKPASIILGGCGLLTTLFAMGAAMIPPPGTEQPWLFELKVVGGTGLLLLTGGFIYLRANRRRGVTM